MKNLYIFLSTPSGWRATKAPGRAGDHGRISIHALRVEGDHRCRHRRPALCPDFYPRPPGGGRRRAHTAIRSRPPISIHALRVEGDSNSSTRCIDLRAFLSTPSGWRATIQVVVGIAVDLDFYPRPPGGGRLPQKVFVDKCRINFYPRPPGGGRLRRPYSRTLEQVYFYPRPPGGGRPVRRYDAKHV